MNNKNKHLLEDYLLYISYKKQLSTLTVNVYNQVVNEYLTFIDNNNIEIETSDVVDIENFISNHNNITSRTINKYLSAIKSFYKFLSIEKIKKDNPSKLIIAPRTKNSLPDVHSQEEVDKLLTFIEEQNDVLSKRDYALFELIYSSSLRVSEASNLKFNDYLREEGVLRITNSKRGKSRIVPIGEKAISAIDNYIQNYRRLFLKKESDYIFISRNGSNIKRCEIWNRLNYYSELLGVHFTVHSLRHSCATHLLENGASLLCVKDILGHSSIKTTEIYTNINRDYIKDEFFKKKSK